MKTGNHETYLLLYNILLCIIQYVSWYLLPVYLTFWLLNSHQSYFPLVLELFCKCFLEVGDNLCYDKCTCPLDERTCEHEAVNIVLGFCHTHLYFLACFVVLNFAMIVCIAHWIASIYSFTFILTFTSASFILKKDPPPQCEHCQCILTVCHILVECNHLAQTRKDIFGGRNVVESVRFHPTLVLLF